jgi:hypothetical protein
MLAGRRRKGKEAAAEKPVRNVQSNRRRAVRHVVCLGSAGAIDPAVHAGGELESWPLVIRDVSVGGVGLLLARRFEPGTELLIECGDGADPGPAKLSARVIRVQPEGHGHWVHGCKFENPLTDSELSGLIKLSNG